MLIKDGSIASVVPTMPLLIAILSKGFVRVMLLAWLVSPSPSASRGRSWCCCSSWVMVFWPSRACRASWGRCICLASCSTYLNKHLVVETELLHLAGIGVLEFLVCLQEVGYLRCLADFASLGDWRGSCLCSKLIPSVTERSALFIKELLFPQTAPN